MQVQQMTGLADPVYVEAFLQAEFGQSSVTKTSTR